MNSLNPELRPDRLQDPDVYDHRVLGTRLDLFHQQEEGPGMVFWHPRGWALYRVIEDYIRRRMREAGFAEIRTPQLLSYRSEEHTSELQSLMRSSYAVFCLKNKNK